MFDAYLVDLLAQKDVLTDRQTDWRTDNCISWAAFAAEKVTVTQRKQPIQSDNLCPSRFLVSCNTKCSQIFSATDSKYFLLKTELLFYGKR